MPDLDAASNDSLQRDIDRVLVPRERIAAAVSALAGLISNHYRRLAPDGGEPEVTILAVLTGSLVFLADLIRAMDLRIRIGVMSASSYPHTATSPSELTIRMPSAEELAGRDVLIVDDILDTGQTLRAIIDAARSFGPRSLRTCVLLAKARPDRPDRIEADFCALDVPPRFVVGYGLDFDDLYRNLPDICVLKPDVLAGRRAGGGDSEARR